ncbi:MAG: Gfo/Idh/MocA family oxidoreductase [Phycisphaeraceae bacterium]|nr:MAG: Gfo/Idh/MocA family oxidoreductase [Phycisphaeraceae bacterium]
MTLRFAIMGTGRIAGKVAPCIAEAEGCDVTVAASRSHERGHEFASEIGIPHACTYDDLLECDDVDAVYVTLPNNDHPVWSEKLLKAGKHVLCEKPLCWTRAEAERLFTLAADRGLVLVEAFMYVHSPLTAEAVRLARTSDSPIGSLRRIEARFDISIEDGHKAGAKSNVRYSRALAGGSVMDLGCYPLSYVRHLTGETPASLEAGAEMVDLFGGSRSDGSDAVDGRAWMRGAMPSGVEFDLTCSMVEPSGHLVEARLIGKRGEAVVRDFPRPAKIEIIAGGETRVIGAGKAGGLAPYTLQAESFARAVGGAEPIPSPAWSIEQAGVIERVLGLIGLKFDG